MALVNSFMQPKTNKISKQRSLRQFFNGGRKRLAISAAIVVAAVGAYFLFFAGASPNNCTSVYSYQDPNLYGSNEQTTFRKIEKMPTKGKLINQGGICDVDQASNGEDSVFSFNEEAYNLGKNGWLYWGTAFRLPNFQQGNSKPLERVFYAPLSIHALMFDGSDKDQLVKNGAQKEFVVGYAWEQEGQPGTVPVYRYERAAPFAQILYTTEKGQGDSWVANDKDWQYKGVAFYAYPPNYLPPLPPQAKAQPTIDSDCDNQTLKRGDSGECVKMLKDVMLGLGFSGDLDKNDPNFDERLNNLVAFAVKGLQNLGKTKTDYLNQVTPEINGILKTALNEKLNPPANTTSPCPGDVGRQLTADEQKKFFEEYKDGVNNQKKTYAKECHVIWLTYGQNQSKVVSSPKTTKTKKTTKPAPVQTSTSTTTESPADSSAPKPAGGIDTCPSNPDNVPAALQAYIDGVNSGKKYEESCHRIYWQIQADRQNLCNLFGDCSKYITQNINKNNPVINPRPVKVIKDKPDPKGTCFINDENGTNNSVTLILEIESKYETRKECLSDVHLIRLGALPGQPFNPRFIILDSAVGTNKKCNISINYGYKPFTRFNIPKYAMNDGLFPIDYIDPNWDSIRYKYNNALKNKNDCDSQILAIRNATLKNYNINKIKSRWEQ